MGCLMCTALLAGVGPLVCDRTDPHTTGHTFTASWLADDHDRAEAVET